MTTDSHAQHEPGYSWVIVGASAVILGVGIGLIANGISVFVFPLNE